MKRRMGIVALLVLINIFPVVSIYAWQMAQRQSYDYVKFRVIVNGGREVVVPVVVDLGGGLSEEECRAVSETVFKHIMGETVLYRLDELSVNGDSIEVHCTWGYNEGDMGHFFDIKGNINLGELTVTHCR